ncbi:hypothetical protein MHBO_001616 [Bonamia ostreae]|uniref:Uncharacterized protein n=1 Tax=Bonamia ostreae TaxID=126728 RepID=A0ABV2AJK6_9EUKA
MLSLYAIGQAAVLFLTIIYLNTSGIVASVFTTYGFVWFMSVLLVSLKCPKQGVTKKISEGLKENDSHRMLVINMIRLNFWIIVSLGFVKFSHPYALGSILAFFWILSVLSLFGNIFDHRHYLKKSFYFLLLHFDFCCIARFLLTNFKIAEFL